MGRRINASATRDMDELAWAERVADALLAGDPIPERPLAPRSAAGDHYRLRGIPMIGGCEGAIPGTSPHRNRRLDRWSGRGTGEPPGRGGDDLV